MSMLSIEQERGSEIDLENITGKFASMVARKEKL
jgi:hypothetical protein